MMIKRIKQRVYDVYLRGKLIDTVFAQYGESSKVDREEEMKRSLVNHDGYNPIINVYERKGE